MRKNRKNTAVVVLILLTLLALLLTACGGEELPPDPNCGIWNGSTASMAGLELGIDDLFEQGIQLELKPKGKAVLTVNGDSVSCKWNYEEGILTVSDRSVTMTGSIEDGVLTLDNLLDSGVNITFTR